MECLLVVVVVMVMEAEKQGGVGEDRIGERIIEESLNERMPLCV